MTNESNSYKFNKLFLLFEVHLNIFTTMNSNKLIKEIIIRLSLAFVFIIPIGLMFIYRLVNVDLWIVKNGFATWMQAPYFSRAIVLILLIGAVLSLFLKFKNSVIKLRWYWLILISFVSFIGLNGLELLEQRDFESTKTAYKNPQDRWSNLFETLFAKYPELNNQKFLLANFSVTCGHCNDYAYKIGATLEGYQSDKKVVFLFWGTTQEIEDFMRRNECTDILFLKTTQSEIFNLVGNGFPIFQIVENGRVLNEFYSRELNNFEMHDYFKIEK